ncbi:TPA: transketolase [Candidatus Dependentiae bacterium]|nr:transketolase [Candidatus Dependentiae bacterium]
MNTNDWHTTLAQNLRLNVLKATTAAGSGHPTSCFSAVEIMTSLFFDVMHYDPCAYEYPNNDRFILSKGHAAPLLYAVWKELGLISEEELLAFRTFNSPLEGHPTARFAFHEAATGSLGQGLAIGVGEALAAHICHLDYRTFVLMGDSELAEGSVWEAAQLANHYKLKNLIVYIDANRLGQRGESLLGTNYEQCAAQWRAFGWDTHIINGHNVDELSSLGIQIRKNALKPTVVIAKTIKGYGLGSAIEDKNGFHGQSFSQETLLQYCKQHPYIPLSNLPHPPRPNLRARNLPEITPTNADNTKTTDNHKKATRRSYGETLRSLGQCYQNLVALDAEVKNSTFSYIFEDAFPERFVECFIAEQSMIGIATGLARRGLIPFCSTFSAFLTRAFDQIRMAAIGASPIRICGSHAGVSIGQDGPSQMGLEDIALFRTLPKSIIFYPADHHATEKCMALMCQYDEGISYIRTTREATPSLYKTGTTFTIGGCHVLKQNENDQICIISAGITLFEALEAYRSLAESGISACVVDCYSIKPLPENLVRKTIAASKNRVIIVEDHYQAGGLGEAISEILSPGTQIAHLCVQELPRSGTPQELRATMGIDAASITVTALLMCTNNNQLSQETP